MSPFQEMWAYAHIKRRQRIEEEKRLDLVRLICTFINPQAADKVFGGEREPVENSGFIEDMKSLSPGFDAEKFEEILDSLGK